MTRIRCIEIYRRDGRLLMSRYEYDMTLQDNNMLRGRRVNIEGTPSMPDIGMNVAVIPQDSVNSRKAFTHKGNKNTRIWYPPEEEEQAICSAVNCYRSFLYECEEKIHREIEEAEQLIECGWVGNVRVSRKDAR